MRQANAAAQRDDHIFAAVGELTKEERQRNAMVFAKRQDLAQVEDRLDDALAGMQTAVDAVTHEVGGELKRQLVAALSEVRAAGEAQSDRLFRSVAVQRAQTSQSAIASWCDGFVNLRATLVEGDGKALPSAVRKALRLPEDD